VLTAVLGLGTVVLAHPRSKNAAAFIALAVFLILWLSRIVIVVVKSTSPGGREDRFVPEPRRIATRFVEAMTSKGSFVLLTTSYFRLPCSLLIVPCRCQGDVLDQRHAGGEWVAR
jgi:hypothetical protein